MARARAIDTRLEKLIPSTDELFVVGILSKEETQQLVKDRTFHEYKLVARPLLLVDVRNAIKFELALEKKIADFCAEFNRKAALEASGVDEKGKKKTKSGAPVKKLTLKHRWAVQERIEQIYRIGLRHLFTQRKTASLLQLKRKATLTTAPLTGVSKKENGSEPLDDYEILRRECVAQLTAFSRQISLSKMYAEWLTRAPQDAFLWSEAALFEATNGRNDEARAIIQQALATLRQTTSSSTSAGTSAQATSTISVKLAGKDFLKQRASEESKEVWGTALVIEILFAKRLLEGAIETAVRANDKTPADSVRGENAALAAIVLDLALAEAIVSECAQPATEGHMPFLCPDLGLYLYSVAVCHQFTAGLCRSVLLQTLAVATKFSSQSPSSISYASSVSAVVTAGPACNPMSLLLTELFLTDIRFTATNCVTAEQFITEKALGDLALLEGKSDGDELRREWVVRNIHRKHRVVSVKEKKEKVLSSIGAALTLILAIHTAEKAMRKAMLSKSEIDTIIAFVQKATGEEATNNDDDDNAAETVFTASLFTSLLRTVISSAAARAGPAAASLSTLNGLKCALSDAIVQLMSLSTELAPIHLDDAQDALRAYSEYVKEAKAAEKAKKEKAAAQDKKAKGNVDEKDDDNNDTADLLDPEAFLATTNKKIFLFSQPESSKILRIVLLLEKNQIGLSAKRSALTIVSALEKAVKSAAGVASSASGKKSKAVTDAAKKEAVAILELFRELCLSASILTQASNEAEGGKKKKKGSRTPDNTEIANRRTIVKIGTSGAQLLKSFAEVAFANANGSSVSVISQQSVDLAAAASQETVVDEADNLDGAFEEDVSPTAQTIDEQASNVGSTPVFSRAELWWASTDSTVIGSAIITIMDTKFLSVRMTPLDLVTFLGVAQPSKTAQSPAEKQTAASSLSISTREEVAVHVSRVLALVDNEAALAKTTRERHTVEHSTIRKIAEAIQTLICTANAPTSQANASNVAGSYLPYEPSVWRLFAALQHSLGSIVRTIVAVENTNEVGKPVAKSSSLVGLKSSRNLDDSSDSDDDEKQKPKKKKLRIGNNGATASSSVLAANAPSAAAVAAATSVISQRDELNNLINSIVEALESTDNKRPRSSTLVELARRLFHISLQIVAGGTSHASLPTFDLRAERLKGILALVTIEVIREIENAVDVNTNPSSQAQLTFNSPAIFLAAQVLRLQKLFHTTAEGGLSIPQVHSLLTQLTRIHNLLLPPIRILELERSSDPLSHGFCTPITRALLRSILIPAYGAAYVAASGIENASDAASSKQKAGLVAAAEKVIHSLITNLTALYTVEVKEAGKLGNGIRNGTQYAVVQKKEVSDHIAQNRSEAFLPYFFLTSVTDGGFAAAASSAAVTKTNIINAQVNDWLLALVFEQQYTKNLAEARSIHARAVQTVEAPQNFLASVTAGSLPALY